MSASSAFAPKARRLLGEVVRFLAVGGLATMVSFVGFNGLVHGMFLGGAPLRDQPIVAFVLVNIVSGCVAYVGIRMWTFRDRDVGDRATGLVRFFALGALTMAIPVSCLWVSRYGLRLTTPLADNLSANVIGLGLGAATRFWVFRRYVFDQVTTPEPWSPTA
jgi:putative flippase GtrA